MASKKQAGKKAAAKATSKAQGRDKPKKAAKSKPKAAKPQDAAGKPQRGFQNPFRIGGSYWAATEGLKALGVGKTHPFAEIIPAVKQVMGEHWKVFAEKGARNEETGKDADHRLLQNISVLTRKDYGKPLRDLGYEIRWNGREKVAGLFKLSSQPSTERGDGMKG